jgi:hypothetical protein
VGLDCSYGFQPIFVFSTSNQQAKTGFSGKHMGAMRPNDDTPTSLCITLLPPNVNPIASKYCAKVQGST